MVKNTDNTYFLESVPFNLGQTARIGELIGRNYYKKHLKGKTNILELDEFVILSYLQKNPNASQAEISKFFFKGKAHIGKILNDMEQKGYITRTVKLENGIMIKHSAVTKLGEKIYAHTDDEFNIVAKKILSLLTEEEIEQFSELLNKYKEILLNNFEISF